MNANTDSIRAFYNFATPQEIAEGMIWYQTAHDRCVELSKRYQKELYQVVGTVSALSPRNKWTRNIEDAENVIKGVKAGLGISSIKVGTFNTNKLKAIACFYSPSFFDVADILKAPKTKSFYYNIYDPTVDDCVTVDNHAKSIYLGYRIKAVGIKLSEYQTISDAYIELANDLGIIPHQLQAITWIAYKRIYKI